MIRFIPILLSILLLSCTDSPNEGVTTFPNSIKGEVVSTGNVSVTLSKVDIATDTIIEKQYATTTKNGHFTFENVEPGRYVAVYKDTNGDMAITRAIEISDESDLELEKKSEFNHYFLRGVIKDSPNATVLIPGIASTTVAVNGVYVLKAPSGNIPIFFQDKKNAILDVSIAINEKDTIGILDISLENSETKLTNIYDGDDSLYTITPIVYASGEEPSYYNNYAMGLVHYGDGQQVNTEYGNSLLIDDFEHDDFPKTVIGSITGSWWYKVDDGVTETSFTKESENGNHFISISTSLSTNYEGPYSSTGFSFGDSSSYNLSMADSLIFSIRGSGKIQLTVEQDRSIAETETNFHKKDIELSPNWKEYRIAFNDLEHASRSWSDVAEQIKNIEFSFAEFIGSDIDTDLHCDIDNIIIKGTTAASILENE